MGRVARYKKAKQFQYQINKEPDLLGPEGKNVPPKPAGSDPTKQMPASLRRMIAAQEKMKEIEASKGKRKRGEDASTTTTTAAQGDKGAPRLPPAGDKKRKKADKETKTNVVKDEKGADDAEPETKKQKTEAPAEKFKFEGMRPNESYKQFTRRLREDTRTALHEKAMEEKKSLSRARKQKLKEKEEKRKQRKLAKKEGEDFVHKDSVMFGEVAQQPPSLTSKPRVKKSAAAVVADAMKQKQGQSPNDGAKKKKEKKKMTKEEKREERERRQKMTEEEKEREKAQEEKAARERRAKQLLLARVMESYKQSKDQKKKQLKEMDPALKRETVHYL